MKIYNNSKNSANTHNATKTSKQVMRREATKSEMELNEDHFKHKRLSKKKLLQQLEHYVYNKFIEAGTSGFSIFINYFIKALHTKRERTCVRVSADVCVLRLSNVKIVFF